MMRDLLASLAGIFLLRRWWAGLVVVALVAQRPADLLALALVLATAAATARCTTGGWSAGTTGMVPINAALVGLAGAHLGAWSPALALLLILGAAIATVMTLVLEADLARLWGLPVLSLPFVMTTWVVHLAAVAAGPLPPPEPGTGFTVLLNLGGWPQGFLSSLGTLILRHDAASGLVLAVLMALHSRILLILAMTGHLTGCAVRWILGGDWTAAVADPTGFTGPLTALLVGGAFLAPGPVALVAGLAAAATATLLDRAQGTLYLGTGLTPLTLSSVVAVFLLLRGVLVWRPALRPLVAEATPEATLIAHRTRLVRAGDEAWDIGVPVAGTWTVWQGVDGPWTHRGANRHALDFVIRDEDGHTHRGAGLELEDYHAWRKPVLAPVSGTVVAVVDGIADNPIGSVDSQHNWGNHVILRDLRGVHVELSHFARGSLRVVIGQWVERGTILGLCGNSGFSAQPHLHCQVQAGGRLGDPTLPFRLSCWRGQGGVHLCAQPQEGDVVEGLTADLRLVRTFDLIPGAVWTFTGTDPAGNTHAIRWDVQRAVDGSLMLTSGRGALVVGLHAGSFRCWRLTGDDPWLALVHRALPSVPLVRLDDLTWHDHLPAGLVGGAWRTARDGLVGLVMPRHGPVPVRLQAHGPESITTTMPGCAPHHTAIDPEHGLMMVTGAGWRLERRTPTSAEIAHVHA